MHLLKKNCNLKLIQNATSLTCSLNFLFTFWISFFKLVAWHCSDFHLNFTFKILLNSTNLVFQIKVPNVLSTSKTFPSAVVLMIDTSIQTETKVTVNEIKCYKSALSVVCSSSPAKKFI